MNHAADQAAEILAPRPLRVVSPESSDALADFAPTLEQIAQHTAYLEQARRGVKNDPAARLLEAERLRLIESIGLTQCVDDRGNQWLVHSNRTIAFLGFLDPDELNR